MGGDFFGNFSPADGVIERLLQLGFMEMIATSLVGFQDSIAATFCIPRNGQAESPAS
jgi:hypothetical protein